MASSPRRRSSGCEISSLSHLTSPPDMLYTDGRGFLICEHALEGCDIEIPFNPTIVDLLAIMNICPIQVSANGWRILLGFVAKCRRDGVVATARLFLYFFYPRWVDNCFISYYRRPGRPKILKHAVSNPKEWQYKFVFIKESGSDRPFWVRASDERTMFPLSWRRPRLGPFECG